MEGPVFAALAGMAVLLSVGAVYMVTGLTLSLGTIVALPVLAIVFFVATTVLAFSVDVFGGGFGSR